jgi:choline-glycine betaine transporter
MLSSVRDPVSGCQAGCPRTEFKLNALPQVGGTLSHLTAAQGSLWLAAMVVALVAAVVLTAVWSGDKDRRKAARGVLALFFRWRW